MIDIHIRITVEGRHDLQH